jgi:hypothetical protein
MRHALFFDAHIGAEGWEAWYPLLREAVERERALGSRIVWVGDTLDYVEDSHVRPPEGLIRPEDLWIPGNHDPVIYPGLEARLTLSLGGVFVAHGDQVDLQYALALLESRGLRWAHRARAYALYRGLIGAPDWAARLARGWFYSALHGGKAPVPWRVLLALAPSLLLSLFQEEARLYPPAQGLPALPVHTKEPGAILEKLLALEPEAQAAHTVVIGHLHPVPHIDARVGERRLIVAPAWPPYPYAGRAGYVVVEEGEAEVVVCA